LKFWAGSKKENRYRITKLMLITGFWYSGQAAKTKIVLLPAQNTKTLCLKST
jgi:hypothetical protein